MKKTICFDFDGVVHSYISGWQGSNEVISDPPVPGIEDLFKQLKKTGEYEIVIHTTRCTGKPDDKGRFAVIKWLNDYGLLKYVDNVVSRKPPARVYIDDRGLSFNGSFDGMFEKIINFESYLDKKNP